MKGSEDYSAVKEPEVRHWSFNRVPVELMLYNTVAASIYSRNILSVNESLHAGPLTPKKDAHPTVVGE